MPPKQGDKVNYQGRSAQVTQIMGTEPNQIFTLKFEDGTERIATIGEIGGPQVDNTLPGGNKPNQDLPSRGGFQGRPKPTPYGDVPIVDPKPPSIGDGAETPNDNGPGTGDTGAGLKADGKDVDSPRRRLLGTEEIVTYIEPATRRVVDKNGRKLEIGQTVHIKARVIGFKAGDAGLMAEVLYPPYRRGSNIPIWSEERKRLEIPNQDDVTKPGGTPYEDGIYSYKDGKIVDVNGGEAPEQPELEKQEKLLIDVRHIERF